MHRDNQVARTFRFGDNGQITRPYTFIGGINVANASGQLPREIRILENGLVVLEDSVIYIAPDLEFPPTLDFDLSVIVVGSGGANTIQTNFAVGTVELIPGVYI